MAPTPLGVEGRTRMLASDGPSDSIADSAGWSDRAALIVDRYAQHANLLEATVASLIGSVVKADTPEEAVRAIAERSFDLIIIDIGYPNAVEMIEMLRERSGASIIAVAKHDSAISVTEALDAGADDYVVAPIRVAELRARVRAITRRHPDRGMKAGPDVG